MKAIRALESGINYATTTTTKSVGPKQDEVGSIPNMNEQQDRKKKPYKK